MDYKKKEKIEKHKGKCEASGKRFKGIGVEAKL